jgi:hypothetical protein
MTRQLVTRRPIALLSARFLPGLDRLVSRISGDGAAFSGWVTGLPIVELATNRRPQWRAASPSRDGDTDPPRLPGRGRQLRTGPQPRRAASTCAPIPKAEIEDATYVATGLAGAHRERAFECALALNPGWRRFQDRWDRAIPVFRLTRA